MMQIMNTYINKNVHTYVLTCTHAKQIKHTSINTSAYIHIHTYIHSYIHAYILFILTDHTDHACMRAYIRAHRHMYTYIHVGNTGICT
jgi:hypothetical protein